MFWSRIDENGGHDLRHRVGRSQRAALARCLKKTLGTKNHAVGPCRGPKLRAHPGKRRRPGTRSPVVLRFRRANVDDLAFAGICVTVHRVALRKELSTLKAVVVGVLPHFVGHDALDGGADVSVVVPVQQAPNRVWRKSDPLALVALDSDCAGARCVWPRPVLLAPFRIVGIEPPSFVAFLAVLFLLPQSPSGSSADMSAPGGGGDGGEARSIFPTRQWEE